MPYPSNAPKAGRMHRRRMRICLPVGQATLVLLIVSCAAFVPAATSGSAAVAHSTRVNGFAGLARGTTTGPFVKASSAQFTSRNWAGYITYDSSEGTDFNVVQATWVEPTVTCPKANAWTVFWVGLDGWWNDTVEQGGTSAECIGGVPQYEAWWEMFPTVSIQTVFAINPGDKVTASVTYVPSTTTFVIVVSDVTSGNSFTRDEQCASDLSCDRSSADVIAEDVGKFGSGSYFPLADYKTMKFTKSKVADVNSDSGTISDSHWLNAAVTEKSGSTTYATVSALNSKGNTFSATWKHE